MLPLFVYGTLRPGERGWRWYLGGLAVAHRPGRLEGYGLYGRTRPYPFVAPRVGLSVLGELVWVDEGVGDEVLARLDAYEGAGRPDPLYLRVIEEIRGGAMPTRAWVWIGGPGLRPDPDELLAAGDWLRR